LFSTSTEGRVIAVAVGGELVVRAGFGLVERGVGVGFFGADDEGLAAEADAVGAEVARAASRPLGWFSAPIAMAPTARARMTARSPPTSSNFRLLGPGGAECDIK
jgi:hypothetical protein